MYELFSFKEPKYKFVRTLIYPFDNNINVLRSTDNFFTIFLIKQINTGKTNLIATASVMMIMTWKADKYREISRERKKIESSMDSNDRNVTEHS